MPASATITDLKSRLLVPFYVTRETHCIEGQVLNIKNQVKEVNGRHSGGPGALTIPGHHDVLNFATASVSMKKMIMMIGEIKQEFRIIHDHAFNDWLVLRG